MPFIVICFLKGKPGMGLLGAISGWFAWIGAGRLAMPGSWRYRTQYDEDTQAAASRRFAKTPDEAISGLYECPVCGMQFDSKDVAVQHVSASHADAPEAKARIEAV